MARPSDAPTPPATLSVVVAAQNARECVAECLNVLEHQRPDGIAQIILVDNSTDGTASYVRQHFPAVHVVRRAGEALIPELWGEGILRSTAEIVGLTTGDMVPDAGWARALLRAYRDESWAGVGGIVLPAVGLGMVDRAVYWLRYSPYAAWRGAGPVDDIPGDNGSYRRAALCPFAQLVRREGFWETEVDALLRAQGAQLLLDSAVLVRYQGGTRFGDFARRRLIHGRRFGAQRISRLRGSQRLLLLAAWPLTPVAFLARIARNARAARGTGSLLGSMPALLPLLLCWSVGELTGYVSGLLHGQIAAGSEAVVQP
jgi:glycosyltransferase involved in cell wall biosynthesis